VAKYSSDDPWRQLAGIDFNGSAPSILFTWKRIDRRRRSGMELGLRL